MAVDVGGIIVVEDNTKLVAARLKEAVERAVEAIGIEAEGDAVSEITAMGAIDTGRLRNSITHTVAEMGDTTYAVIGTNVEYGKYVHEGTSRMKGRPFLRSAVTKNKDKYGKIAEAAFKSS